MDPYEQQLLSVFNSYDISHRGSLDQDGLLQLCNSLQLEEQGVELVKCLVSDAKSHVTFNEFKEGLLALLGNGQQHHRQKDDDFNASSDSETESPDREVSPKFVYGSKKYGRRSRPESTEQIELFEHAEDDGADDADDDDLEQKNDAEVFTEKYENKSLNNINKVQRSNSQSDVTHSRKRKTSGKLKRCTSFPGNREMERQFKTWHRDKHDNNKMQSANSDYYSGTLQSALEQLAVGSDGFLTHLEIIRVCEVMGLHKLAKDLLQQTTNNKQDSALLNRKVSVEEFLEVLQKDDCVYEMSSPTSLTLNNSCITEDSVVFNKSLQYITMGPNGSGMISSQGVVELWENAGISSASSLLQELGFTEPTIDIVDLATILDDELRNLNDSRTDISFSTINPHIVLLQASIALYQSEVKYLKAVLDQLSAERDKLRTDIADANHRASLLAQEVDDNHAKMEKSTQNQVRLLEQRHSDIVKEMSMQFAGEKEHLSSVNNKLEHRISSLETEESKLRSDLLAVQKYNNSLEKENLTISTQLSALETTKTSLAEKVNVLQNECRRISDMERERDQLVPLLKQLSFLQTENSDLRDKNDELSTEIEMLNAQVSAHRSKMSSTPTPLTPNQSEESVVCEGVAGGLGAIKRRVNSPSKESACGMESESPRLGKVRRCYHTSQPGEVLLEALLPFNASESGFEADLDCLDSSLLSFSESCSAADDVPQLHARIAQLEHLLAQHSIPLPSVGAGSSKNADDCTNDNNQTKLHLIKRCKQLESLLEEVQISVTKMISKRSECKDNCDLFNPVSQLSDRLQGIALDTAPPSSAETEVRNALAAKEQRCDDLEQALEMLRNEFDNCENYWSNKLDDERQLFEQEHKQSSDKLTELLIKISEYEEQFAAQDCTDGRLSPIEEKACLESQFTELEDEYEQFRGTMQQQLDLRDKEIAILQLKLNAQKTSRDFSIQVDLANKPIHHKTKLNNLSNVIESTDIFPSETLPETWQYPAAQEDPTFIWTKPEQESNPAGGGSSQLKAETCSSLPPNISWSPPLAIPSPQPHSLNYPSCRPKRTRKHIFTAQMRPQKKDADLFDGAHWNHSYNGEQQTCVVPLNSIHHLHGRLRELDQHCRHLQFILKQQQRHSESVMHHCWQQHRDELNELQLQLKSLHDKLARSDMLVKDLYVENTYLMANNQRLEHRCHMLVQCNSESTSV